MKILRYNRETMVKKKSKANMSNEPKIKQNLRKNEKVQANKWGKEGGETIGSNIVHQNATSRRYGRRHCQGRAWDAETGTRKREKERPWPVSGVRKVRCQTFHISLKSFSPFFRALKLTYYPRQTKRSLFPEVKRLQANFFFSVWNRTKQYVKGNGAQQPAIW